MNHWREFLFVFLFLLLGCKKKTVAPPAPVFPVPSREQLDWQDLEFYAFVHFNMNTFTNKEWGYGDERPEWFNPSELDCRQWARVFKEAGMKGVILTVKHHDGFCLWPSRYTEHSVKNAPWKGGKGDVVRELSEACKEYGLKFGVYLSPWDRNHPDYGKAAYIEYFRKQLRELLTDYGEVFEVWFDGANGGTGYYGGANEERKVDKLSYYDWENTYPIIYELQPGAIIFSDAGPGCRWVGNEHGYAYPSTWSNLMLDSVYGGMPEYAEQYSMGQENGTHWVPAEADVSIRPGWYYHEYEEHKVKSLPHLLDIYYRSVGQNANLLLNFPVDKRGLIHENDVRQLQRMAAKLKEDFARDLAAGSTVSATNERGPGYEAGRALDGEMPTYWAAEDGVIRASLTIAFQEPITFNRFLVQEYIPLGQRVKVFTLEAKTAEGWREIASETTIGYKRILRLPEVTATALRLNIKDSKACPAISNVGVYHAPKLVVPPVITRDKWGEVSLEVPEAGLDIFYTLDGSEPAAGGRKYEGPFPQSGPVVVQAIATDPNTGNRSEVSRADLDVAPAKWKVLSPEAEAQQVVDGLGDTWWASPEGSGGREVIIDLGEILHLNGFTYLPMQDRWISGFISDFEFFTSTDNRTWTLAVEGEFGNIQNSPVLQRVSFDRRPARYIKLKATATVDGQPASFAEIGVLTGSQ